MSQSRNLSKTASDNMIEELLADELFQRICHLVTKELIASHRIDRTAALRLASSAIGEPDVLAAVYRAWSEHKQGLKAVGLAKSIVRHHVLNHFARDARRPGHVSFEDTGGSDADPDEPVGQQFQRSSQSLLEQQETIVRVNQALDCFEAMGPIQERRAKIIRLRSIEGLKYRQICRKLGGPENQLRNRFFYALRAFQVHVRKCHPELQALL